jgi:hypothetical protein
VFQHFGFQCQFQIGNVAWASDFDWQAIDVAFTEVHPALE